MVLFAHTLLCFALLGAASGALLSARWLRRHTTHPDVVRRTAFVSALLLVPAATICTVWHHSTLTGPASVTVQVLGWASIILLLVVVRGTMIAPPDDEAAPRPRRVLAVGAHPDDLELGCGATLARWIDAGYEVHGLVMSNGERGGTGVRPAEARSAGNFLGAQSVTVLNFPDTRLADSSSDMVVAIEEHVSRLQPDIILTHSSNDSHQDHKAVHLATLRAARFHTTLLCYESPSATTRFRPTVFVDVGGYVDVKVLAIATHRDQSDKPYMTGERIRATACYRGGQAKVRHAEGYEPVRVLASMTTVLP
jgi:LmbE family N-acetylglucosaminyl deacetylase